MFNTKFVIPVIASILILGTVGLSQNADATHNYQAEVDYYLNFNLSDTLLCSNTIENAVMNVNNDFLIMAKNPVTHEDCVYEFLNNVEINAPIYNFGTIIINPKAITITSNSLIENHGTIIIEPKPTLPELTKEEKQQQWNDYKIFMFTFGGWKTEEFTLQESDFPKEWNNFVNVGTIINYGTIQNNGEMLSTGKIINKGSVGLFDPSGKFYNNNLLINKGEPIENGGIFNSYSGIFQSTTAVHDYCGSYVVNPSTTVSQVGTIDKCVPVTFTKPVDNWTICEAQHPTFEWKDSNPFASQTYKFWLTPGNYDAFKFEEAWLPKSGTNNPWSYQLDGDLPIGIYDYNIARADSTGAVVSLPDVQRVTVKKPDGNCPDIFESMIIGDPITILISSNFNVRAVINSGSLQIDDLVVFVNDGTQMYEKSLTAQTIGGYSNESLKVLVNPNGENGVLVDKRLSSLEHNNEVYSFKYGGDCDANGIATLVEAKSMSDKTDWNCTITFDYLGDKPPEPTINNSGSDEDLKIYPPSNFVLPDDIVIDATDDSGAVVSYSPVTATDVLGEDVPVQCSPSLGSLFSVGVTIVKCSAIQDQGYPFEDEFKVTVNPPPSIFDLPYSMTEVATDDSGAVVNYPAVTATDPDTGESLIVECDPAAGSVFSIGQNTVFCSTIDSTGKYHSSLFGITVLSPQTQESIPEPPTTDLDSDTISDNSDNCPTIFNPDQTDSDSNGIGDACESIPELIPPPPPIPEPQTEEETPTPPEPKKQEATIIPPTPEPKKQVPTWIKNNAKWWADGAIDEKDFVNGIQHMIQEKIIDIPDLPEKASTTAQQKVPDWIKNNAGWWADGLISEADFVNGLKFLVEKGIVQVN